MGIETSYSFYSADDMLPGACSMAYRWSYWTNRHVWANLARDLFCPGSLDPCWSTTTCFTASHSSSMVPRSRARRRVSTYATVDCPVALECEILHSNELSLAPSRERVSWTTFLSDQWSIRIRTRLWICLWISVGWKNAANRYYKTLV